MTCGKYYPIPQPIPGTKIIPGNAVVFDLDSTLAESTWPDGTIGAPMRKGIDALFHYAGEGYNIYIDTARNDITEDELWTWVKYNDLPVDMVRVGKKLPAGLYVDDRGWNPYGV